MVRRTVILGAMAALAVAACSGGGSTPTPAAASVTQAPGAAATAGSGSGSGGSSVIDVCQVVTQADVAPFFTGPMTAEEDTSQTGEHSQCFYQVTPHDGLAPMQIYVVSGDQAASALGAFSGGNEGALPMSGIGDQAVRQPGQASFAAIRGSTFCSVQLGAGNSAHYAGLPAPDADGNLPDAAAEAYALRLAALCDKIWAAAGA